MRSLFFALAAGTAVSACAHTTNPTIQASMPSTFDVTAVAEDGVTVFGSASFDALPDTAPLIVLFHQGGSNARAEYGPLVPWLNQSGFRTIAWDLRVGGDIYGQTNRTADARRPVEPDSYCEGYPDMRAALDHSLTYASSGDAIIWGSSYSAALVFHLAGDEADKVSHVIAASPASGPPMVDCLARARLEDLKSPAFVLRPASEMRSPNAQEQKSLFEAAGVSVLVLEDGIHGSSMLVDARTESDMSDARNAVVDWLKSGEDAS